MRSAATVLLLLVLAAGGATPRMPPGDEAADEVGLGDDCDWFGSGLSGPERGVSPVYLRCSQGRVRWSYPRGALRVLLRAGGAGKEFRGCVRLGPHAQGARIFLEGPRSLAPLFRDDEEEDNSVLDQEVERGAPVCFRSRGGVAVLFVDAAGAATPLAPHAVEFFYHLHPDAADAPSLDHADDVCAPQLKEWALARADALAGERAKCSLEW